MVIGAVGAEVGLRTEHLVHHIQTAHGGEDHGAELSAKFGRGGNINPGGEGHTAGGRGGRRGGVVVVGGQSRCAVALRF